MERVLLKGTDMSLDLSDAMRQIEAFSQEMSQMDRLEKNWLNCHFTLHQNLNLLLS